MLRFKHYNYDQSATVVINYQEQLQPGTFERAVHYHTELHIAVKTLPHSIRLWGHLPFSIKLVTLWLSPPPHCWDGQERLAPFSLPAVPSIPATSPTPLHPIGRTWTTAR